MSNWGNAIAGAVGAVANVGSQALDRQMATQDKIDAEQRAADLQLDLHQRMAAADEMMKNRAAERFATVTQQKLGEPVVNPDPVDQTGISRASAEAAGTGTGFEMDPQALGQLEQNAKKVLTDPKATDEQKQDAQGILDQLARQKKAQGDINAKDAEANNKVRPRSLKEARDAAFEATAATDPAAFIAGRSMWQQAMQDDRLDAKDKAAQDDKDADRTSREKIAGMNVEQRAKAAADRAEVAKQRIESLAGGKGAKATALMQNYQFMVDTMGKTPEEAQQILFHAKDSSEAEKVFKLLMHDKYGELTPEEAFKKVRGIETAGGGKPAAPAANTGGKVRTWNPTTRKFE